MSFALSSALAQFNGDFEIRPYELDDENFLDWKAYQPQPRWRHDSVTVANRLQGSVGSISMDRFYLEHDLRLEADVGRYLTFLYSQDQEEFFRSEAMYQEVELRAGSGVYGSLLGWVAGDKRENHIGYALAYGERTDWNYVRASWLNQYQLFNKKNQEGPNDPVRYDRSPILLRLEWRFLWQNRFLLEADIKREELAVFQDLALGLDRTYEGREVKVTLEWWGPERRWLAGTAATLDEEDRRQIPGSGNTTTPRLNQELRLAWWDLYASVMLDSGHFLTFGYLDSRFENRIGSEVADSRFRTKLDTRQVYATLETNPESWAHGLFGAFLGQADSETRIGILTPESGNEDHLQVKASAGLVLAEAERYRFLFNSTWDLDILADRAWDGGNVQVQIFF